MSDTNVVFADISTNMDSNSIRVESFENVNKKRIKEALKILKINTNTQDGNSFSDTNNFDYEGSYKQTLLAERIKKVRKDATPLYDHDNEGRTQTFGNEIQINDSGVNVLAQKGVKRINRMYAAKKE
jgi:hypothetical protein